MLPQPVKTHNLMQYANMCIKHSNWIEDAASFTTAPNSTRCLTSNGWQTCNNNLLMRSTISTVLKATLGALVFSQVILLNISLIAEWQTNICNRETLQNDALLKSNQQCINYGYNIGHWVLRYGNTIKWKLAIKISDHFEIVCVHMNSIITILVRAGVTEQKIFVPPFLSKTL